MKKETGKGAQAGDRPHVIRVPGAADMTRERMLAELAADGVASNAHVLTKFGKGTFGELQFGDALDVLRTSVDAANDGNLTAAVRLLTSQAIALNAIFGELARVAHVNMYTAPQHADRYLRLSFKAQGQCRATLETMAAIKNPPVVFARQANINNGGQQQVNNGAAPTHEANSPHAHTSAHAGGTVSEPNELLEEALNGRTPLDAAATSTAIRAHPNLVPVGAVHRPEKH
jgi:hypothetical protein